MSIVVLHHLSKERRIRAINEMFRVTKLGGQLKEVWILKIILESVMN